MKILMIDKYHFIKGGAETYYFTLKKLLENNGHQVEVFSMKDEKNIPYKFDEYFVENINYNNTNKFTNKIKMGLNIIYSFEAARKLENLLKVFKPDIAHIHVFQHQLSPSILHVLKKNNIPMVHTVHDLKILCPNYKMLSNERLCEKCSEGKYYNCVLQKCMKESLGKSVLVTLEAYLHKFLKSYEKIDVFITPSKFFKNKFIDNGYDEGKMVHISNFLMSNHIHHSTEYGDYFVFVGRLSEEKGLKTLIQAMQYCDGKLIIIGTGPLEEEIKKQIEDLFLEEKVTLAGFKSGDELEVLVQNARFVVLTSECYENSPYSILEAMAIGKPVIGSNIGGIPEYVFEGINGYLFEKGNELDLAVKISKLYFNDNLIEEMGRASKRIFLENYTEDKHYQEIIQVYNNLLNF